ncbi:acyl-CoA synthetase [Methylobacterium isbiliense]|uniref:Long-chain-fatty-acid--CoA ligase n=1 Tax=Methylobacterium isbiliense TaxID=315478 RepID=A0ABQ4S954_9HYPH|nr:AMP-binding protein [Methylobacterium isbiliense]MDN3623135.1 AMP-binding protein [Methylobacterium isbiliense]GJD98205.1 Long-chain-fatty-acid--CoA ligase [Methylobacterium isbiliense]
MHARPPDSPPPARFNAARYCLEANARTHPDKPALILVGDGDRAEVLSFGEVDRAVRAVAAGLLDLGLNPGSRVMIRMGNDADYAIVYFAALAAGLVAQPSSPQLTAAEAAFLLRDSGAAAIVAAEECPLDPEACGGRIVLRPADVARLKAGPALPAYADTAADDPAHLIYTSGTTSRPKGVLHAHRAIWGRRPMHDHWLGLRESDVVLHAGTMNWTYTLGVGIQDPWARGATTVLYTGRRDPAVWPALIDRYRATLFAAVPSLYRQILKYADLTAHDLGSLRHGITAGEALSPHLLAEWTAATGKPLYEALGMSEVSTYISTCPGVPVKPGSPGRPQPGRRVAILPPEGEPAPLAAGQTGLLAVHRSDPGLMLGYWNRPEEEAAVMRGEWFTGGDLARFDEDGYVWFEGRNDDVMNAFGYRVSPNEVEAVLVTHPDVQEGAVAERAVRADVRVIAAYVVPKPGTAPRREDLLAWCQERLAGYKCPREVVFLEALPRTPNGKVQRKRLAEAAG